MELTGWGRYPRLRAKAHRFEDETSLKKELERPAPRGEGLIVHARGRSYGDSSLSGEVILTDRFRDVLEFNPETGFLVCESGLTLTEIIEAFLPRGWFPATTPGTKYITVGGAVASDIHGKNHHISGSFSNSVEWLDLMLDRGEVVRCSREERPELFRATCGGMGLTGIILRVGLKLAPLPSAFIREKIVITRNLEETFQAFEENREAPYSMAWIDCLIKEPFLGRSVLNLGWPQEKGKLVLPPEPRLNIPLDFPGFVLNRFSMSVFNRLNYAVARQGPRLRVRHLEGFFYPLDSILNWNRMYGRGGFTQYQFVLPKEASLEGLRAVLSRISSSGLGANLGVLKLLGPANDNLLSFPMEGYTLALDFKIQEGLFPLLDELDSIVVDFGGRIYLTKDVRMKPETFKKGYPNWESFAELRRKLGLGKWFNSLQSKRLGV